MKNLDIRAFWLIFVTICNKSYKFIKVFRFFADIHYISIEVCLCLTLQ